MNEKYLQKLICLLVTSTVFMGLLVGCGNDSKQVTASTPQKEETKQKEETQPAIIGENTPVKFADSTFEKYLRKAMGNLGGEITEEDLAEIKQMGIDVDGDALAISNITYEYDTFDILSAYEQASIASYDFLDPDDKYNKKPILIESLEDLKHFTNLEVLVINQFGEGVQVKNLNFLKSLPNLQCFQSDSLTNSVTLEPFSQCKELKEICLQNYNAKYPNINDLVSCTKLKRIKIWGVDDWSAILEFSELEEVRNDRKEIDEQIKHKLVEKGINVVGGWD